MTSSILIVGAGIAGRTAARVLDHHGLECTVAEQRGPPAELGMGLNLPGNATRALRELGVLAHVMERGVHVHRREYRNARGKLLFATNDSEFWAGVGPPLCVRHGHLLAALQLPAGIALRAARVIAATPSPAGVDVTFEGETRPQRFDLVIGADGVHSAVRAALSADSPRRSTMTGSSWRFIAATPGLDCWTAWSGASATFLMIPVEAGRVYGYAARTRGGHTGSDRTWLTSAAESFPAVVQTGVRQALENGQLHHAPVEEVRLPRWHSGRLVLIGDAAHATGPVWAQGAAMAIEDAMVLGDLLARTPPDRWAEVGAEFERLRRHRIEHVQSTTDRMSRLAALPGWLRDLGAPLLGPRSYRSAYGLLRTSP